jgi:hypothetical protein
MQNFTLGGTSAPQNVHFSRGSTGGGGGGATTGSGSGGDGGGATLAPTLVPQAMQNFTLGGTSAPQKLHFNRGSTGGGAGGGAASAGAPHRMQNFMPASTGALQLEHVMTSPLSRLRLRSSTDAAGAGA